MRKGNVLFIGNSGVGKTTLINAIMKEEAATGFGVTGTTTELKTYENDDVAFRIIDTIGFEPAQFLKVNKAISEVKKWSKDAATSRDETKTIDAICLCVDGTSSKLFKQTIDSFIKAVDLWKSVPIIVAITKSYSEPDVAENVKMITKAFEGKKRNFRGIYPVVAAPYIISDDYVVPPRGINELIDAINELLPEGIKSSKEDMDSYLLSRKRFQAQGTIGAFTTIGATIGAVPIPFSDAALLVPTETAEITVLSRIYGIKKEEKSKELISTMVKMGTVSVVSKGIISGLKAIPGINIGASVLNAVIAGVIVTAIGEGSVYAFEQIYLGNKTIEDVEWIETILKSKMADKSIIDKASKAMKDLPDKPSAEDIAKLIKTIFGKKSG